MIKNKINTYQGYQDILDRVRAIVKNNVNNGKEKTLLAIDDFQDEIEEILSGRADMLETENE
tara:strand:+ start:1326 stop:1511 length:186 start_codon:yes stop_codon:yes gene_type:complete